ncbi:MAG: ribbon-helix-helix protein, CopG family [Acidobacteria bacterium]|nr:ribbon-helix-helix protein, CopG family [Acidobacteriota bacterium]
MPTSIKLDDRLAEKVAALAADAGQPIDAFVERVLQGLVDADIELRDGIPVFRMPPGAPVLTAADVNRLLHSDLDS